jgi:hypothetical protein
MISAAEAHLIWEQGYVPEHVPGYATAVSGADPFLSGPYLCYLKQDHLIFVGYRLPRSEESGDMVEELDRAVRSCRPHFLTVLGESPSTLPLQVLKDEADWHYRIDFAQWRLTQNTRNMISRAGRELAVEVGKALGPAHMDLIATFAATHQIDLQTELLHGSIPHYLASSPTVLAFTARERGGGIAAFDIAEFGSRDYAFYMFNFRCRKRNVPGASDLLLHEIIEQARGQGKRFLNMGLGINDGVSFFKKKWGAEPFLPYRYRLYALQRPTVFKAILEGFWMHNHR